MTTPLETLNKLVRENHGNRLTEEQLFSEAGVDSFGVVFIFSEMDDVYGCFSGEWLRSTDFKELTVKDIISKIENESTKL